VGIKHNRLIEDFPRLAAALTSIEARVVALHEQTAPVVSIQSTPLQRAKVYYRKRRSRERIFGRSDMFADPAWDILIDLFIAYEEGRGISISSACIASAVPTTTALRWLKLLEEEGHISRTMDPSDARRVNLYLSEATATKVRQFFSD
jgi:hypothetical protein